LGIKMSEDDKIFWGVTFLFFLLYLPILIMMFHNFHILYKSGWDVNSLNWSNPERTEADNMFYLGYRCKSNKQESCEELKRLNLTIEQAQNWGKE